MKTKDIRVKLRACRYLCREIGAVENLIAEARVKAENCTAKYGPEGGGGSGNGEAKFAAPVEKILEYEATLKAKRRKLLQQRLDALNMIDLCAKSLTRTVLYQHYLNGNSIRSIGKSLNYSDRQVNRIIWDGVCEIFQKMAQNVIGDV